MVWNELAASNIGLMESTASAQRVPPSPQTSPSFSRYDNAGFSGVEVHVLAQDVARLSGTGEPGVGYCYLAPVVARHIVHHLAECQGARSYCRVRYTGVLVPVSAARYPVLFNLSKKPRRPRWGSFSAPARTEQVTNGGATNGQGGRAKKASVILANDTVPDWAFPGADIPINN